jgi:hypothetical protein
MPSAPCFAFQPANPCTPTGSRPCVFLKPPNEVLTETFISTCSPGRQLGLYYDHPTK